MNKPLHHALVVCLAGIMAFLFMMFGISLEVTLLTGALLSGLVGTGLSVAQKRSESRSASQVGTGTKKSLKADQTGSQSVSGHSQSDVTPEVAALMKEFECKHPDFEPVIPARGLADQDAEPIAWMCVVCTQSLTPQEFEQRRALGARQRWADPAAERTYSQKRTQNRAQSWTTVRAHPAERPTRALPLVPREDARLLANPTRLVVRGALWETYRAGLLVPAWLAVALEGLPHPSYGGDWAVFPLDKKSLNQALASRIRF